MEKRYFIILILLLVIGCENKEIIKDYNVSIGYENNTAKFRECYGECTESLRYCVNACMNKNCEILFSDFGEKQNCFDKLFNLCVEQCNIPTLTCIEHCNKTYLMI